MPHWQTERQPQSAENAAKAVMSSRLRLVDPVDLVDLADLVDLRDYWRASAKLELRFVDVQCLDAMVKRGWWHSELRRSP